MLVILQVSKIPQVVAKCSNLFSFILKITNIRASIVKYNCTEKHYIVCDSDSTNNIRKHQKYVYLTHHGLEKLLFSSRSDEAIKLVGLMGIYSVRKWFDNQQSHKVLYIASCHRDIIDWLDPDWVYDTDLQVLDNRRPLFRLSTRPELTLTIRSTNLFYWQFFKKYHYLTSDISKSAHYYVLLLGDKPIGFHAAIHSTNRDIHSYWRGHRTVILPEFQGMGIGTAFSDAIAEMYVSKGLRYFSKTAHPSFGEHRENSELWRPTSTNKKSRLGSYLLKDGTARKMPGYGGTTTARDAGRICYSHEYIGKKD